ncbi:hypothetical protein C8Q74DRAFT_547463 [Fomes fomentarius]|nr:hypothetical protein C8Q74DRAFT_547463 [Fomes fomentarius]
MPNGRMAAFCLAHYPRGKSADETSPQAIATWMAPLDSRADSLILNASSNSLFQHYLWHDYSCSPWWRPGSIPFAARGMHTASQEPTSISARPCPDRRLSILSTRLRRSCGTHTHSCGPEIIIRMWMWPDSPDFRARRCPHGNTEGHISALTTHVPSRPLAPSLHPRRLLSTHTNRTRRNLDHSESPTTSTEQRPQPGMTGNQIQET